MKVTITVTGNAARRLARRAEILSAAVRNRLTLELRDELRSRGTSEHVDPETHRAALDRAVRRIRPV